MHSVIYMLGTKAVQCDVSSAKERDSLFRMLKADERVGSVMALSGDNVVKEVKRPTPNMQRKFANQIRITNLSANAQERGGVVGFFIHSNDLLGRTPGEPISHWGIVNAVEAWCKKNPEWELYGNSTGGYLIINTDSAKSVLELFTD